MKKTFSMVLCLSVFLCLFLTGCSNNDIVGSWVKVNNSNKIVTFYDDGTCLNAEKACGKDADAWRIQDDDTLIFFKSSGEIAKSFIRTDNLEIALDDSDFYYLDNDYLVIKKKEFLRQKN